MQKSLENNKKAMPASKPDPRYDPPPEPPEGFSEDERVTSSQHSDFDILSGIYREINWISREQLFICGVGILCANLIGDDDNGWRYDRTDLAKQAGTFSHGQQRGRKY